MNPFQSYIHPVLRPDCCCGFGWLGLLGVSTLDFAYLLSHRPEGGCYVSQGHIRYFFLKRTYIAPENRPFGPKKETTISTYFNHFSGAKMFVSRRLIGIWKNYKKHLKLHWTVWILMQTFRISLGNITWLKAVKMKGFSWRHLPYMIIYVGEMFINLVFSWTRIMICVSFT